MSVQTRKEELKQQIQELLEEYLALGDEELVEAKVEAKPSKQETQTKPKNKLAGSHNGTFAYLDQVPELDYNNRSPYDPNCVRKIKE